MTIEELEILLEKYHLGRCTPEETAFVDALLNQYIEKQDTTSAEALPPAEKQALLQVVRERITAQTGIELDNGLEKVVSEDGEAPVEMAAPVGAKYGLRNRLRRLVIIKAAAAAAVLMILVGTYFYFLGGNTRPKNEIVKTAILQSVRPGTTSASLLLDNGQRIGLDSSRAGNISTIRVRDGYVCIVKKSGQQIYLNKTARLDVYNTLVTARGQQAPEMTLSDGTKVWLNAASKLHFPVQFSGLNREVTLTGEAYFEVAKDASHPFIVKTDNSRIRVLGTHFNVMAYNDEPNTYATLLEGVVQFEDSNGQTRLAPGQQGIVSRDGKIKVAKVDVDQSVAWLHGKLPMDNMNVQAFLREVSRWYDVDIVYKEAVPSQTFSGNLKRDVPLSHILSALQANGIHCELRSKTVFVSN